MQKPEVIVALPCKRCGCKPRPFTYGDLATHETWYKLYCPNPECETEYVETTNRRETIHEWNAKNGKEE